MVYVKNVRKKILLLSCVFICLVFPSFSHSQEFPLEAIEPENSPAQNFFRARVIEILSDESRASGKTQIRSQSARLEVLSGPDTGSKIEAQKTGLSNESENQWYKVGATVVMSKVTSAEEIQYDLVDQYRLKNLIVFALLFIIFAIAVGGKKTLWALVGLVASLGFLSQYFLPGLASEKNPFTLSLMALICISFLGIYIAHGFSKRTHTAAVSAAFSLVLTLILSWLSIHFLNLSGSGSEEAQILGFIGYSHKNLQGLLLLGLAIGALGILDDITTSQAAVVDEMVKNNTDISKQKLFASAMSVGKEHIAGLINTLFLAYAATSLPLLLLLTKVSGQPWWVLVNSEFFAEESIRALVGSFGLILSVPITTLVAVKFFTNNKT